MLSSQDARELIEAGELESRWREVIVLCAEDPAARAELRDLRAQLGEASDGEYWVGVMLGVLHEEPFVALEPEQRRGIVGAMSGVADNFQLHTLLMDAFGLATVNAAAVALGDGPQQTEESIVGAWDMCDHVGDWIWGEGVPADIPVLDGHRVIVLRPPSYSRTWQSQRTFDVLAAGLSARPLEPGEYQEWLARLG